MNINPSYLPSPEFRKKAFIVLVLVVIILLITWIVPKLHKKIVARNEARSLIVKDLVAQDQNQNGIQDWEEALWGLDPSTNGPENREFIISKKKFLNKDNIPDGEISEDEKMAREFFALIVSLQQSGNLSSESMDAIAKEIGNNVSIEDLADVYKKENLIIENSTPATITKYYKALQALNKKYAPRDIGGELVFIGQAIANNDDKALDIAIKSGSDYRSFGKDLVKIPVPTTLAVMHLELANNYEKNALALENMSGMLDSPTKGMSALISYKKYNDALLKTLSDMTLFFQKNGIIKS